MVEKQDEGYFEKKDQKVWYTVSKKHLREWVLRESVYFQR